MGSLMSSSPARPHPLFHGVFSTWQAKAGALSALPDAPVVADDSGPGQPVWRRLRSRFGRSTPSR